MRKKKKEEDDLQMREDSKLSFRRKTKQTNFVQRQRRKFLLRFDFYSQPMTDVC